MLRLKPDRFGKTSHKGKIQMPIQRVLEIAVNTGLHDVNHLEQVLHCLP